MPAREGCVGMASDAGVKVVMGPVFLLTSIYGGHLIARAIKVEDEGGSVCDAEAKISCR